MTRANGLPDAIAWHDGMMLAPQHFQQLVRRQDSILHYRTEGAVPYSWGIRRLRIDPALLVGGIARVLELEAVMPDGQIIWHSAGQAGDVLELNLSSQSDELTRRSMLIAVVIEREGSGRFVTVDGPPVTDPVSGGRELAIPRFRPRLQLIAGDHPPERYVALPLMRIRHRNEEFVPTDYVPPMMSVSWPGSPLGRYCDAVARLVREKAVFLAEQARSSAIQSDAAARMTRRLQIHSLAAVLAEFEALLRSGVAHPFNLYLGLCNLAGHASALGRALVPPLFEAYNHLDLLATFRPVLAHIRGVIKEGVVYTHSEHAFRRLDQSFQLQFDEDWMSHRLVLGVRAGSGMTSTDVVKWVWSSVICGRESVLELRKHRMRGLSRTHVERSDGLVPGQNMALFELTVDRRYLRGGEPLIIFRPDDREGATMPAEALLYVFTGDEARAAPAGKTGAEVSTSAMLEPAH